jgi:hypothetical protein
MVRAIVVGMGLACAWPAGGQTRKPGQQGPVKAVQPTVPKEWLPDLVVTSAEASAMCTPQGTVTATVIATVKNQSPKGTADLSKVPFQIVLEVSKWWSTTSGTGADLEQPPGSTVKPQAGGPQSLKPGESWTGKLSIAGIPRFKKGPTKPGQYGFNVKADPSNAVAEGDEANNEKVTFAFDPCFKF